MKRTVSRLEVCVVAAHLVLQPEGCVQYSVNLSPEFCGGLNRLCKHSSQLGMGELRVRAA